MRMNRVVWKTIKELLNDKLFLVLFEYWMYTFWTLNFPGKCFLNNTHVFNVYSNCLKHSSFDVRVHEQKTGLLTNKKLEI